MENKFQLSSGIFFWKTKYLLNIGLYWASTQFPISDWGRILVSHWLRRSEPISHAASSLVLTLSEILGFRWGKGGKAIDKYRYSIGIDNERNMPRPSSGGGGQGFGHGPFGYSQFYKTLQNSRLQMHWISVRFYEMVDISSGRNYWITCDGGGGQGMGIKIVLMHNTLESERPLFNPFFCIKSGWLILPCW